MTGPYRLGVDVGGTFTDIAAFDEDRIFEPGEAIDLEFDPARAHLFAADDDPAAPH